MNYLILESKQINTKRIILASKNDQFIVWTREDSQNHSGVYHSSLSEALETYKQRIYKEQDKGKKEIVFLERVGNISLFYRTFDGSYIIYSVHEDSTLYNGLYDLTIEEALDLFHNKTKKRS